MTKIKTVANLAHKSFLCPKRTRTVIFIGCGVEGTYMYDKIVINYFRLIPKKKPKNTERNNIHGA